MQMSFFPLLGLGWYYGWVLLCVWWTIQGLSLILQPRDVRKRLFELNRSSWPKKTRVLFAMGKLVALIFLVVAALSPIYLNSIEFLVGIAVFVIGLIGLVGALWNFKNTPLDSPVSVGLYKVSRHPQLVMQLIIGIGLSIALNSWFLLILRLASFGLEHPGVIAEENECLERFGESYKEYLERVPRYLFV